MTFIPSLSETFKGELVTPADAGYTEAIARWARNAVRKAKIVAFVKDAEDVSVALKYAKASRLSVAIRGGGHNAAAASSCTDGLVIDLSRYLNKVTVDADKKLAYVGGGSLWKTVDEECMKHGLATVGGTVNHTGVGGLTVGGGYGFLTGLHGLAIDNLAAATVVVADGSILKASATENPDLFYGIRGGGSNFGVVTEFVFRLHPHPRTIFAGVIVFTPDKLEAIAAVMDAWWANAKPQEAIFIIFGRPPPTGHPMILASLVYHGPEAEARANFKPLLDLGPVMDTAKEIPYETLNGMQNDFARHGANYYMKGTLLSKVPSQDLTRSTFNRVIEISKFGELDVMMAFEYVSQTKVNSVSPDETPFRRDSPGNGIIWVTWHEDGDEKQAQGKEAAHILAKLTPEGEAYGNYAGQDSDGLVNDGALPADKVKKFFAKAYPKLQLLKKKYDPDVIFDKWYPIVPAA
ncbi:hypothetical protein BXZ70DRAFT_58556 [Cristinia sonorae]|uniref:FAD-binding PCMH-type domain-containing protein n=1 Tax=Cristinia sonorae TaxID=1940300 RepID=A0A8K0UQM9_9AGAR|nr:hypothetical protein BXZ70DRAFT_58556 [Cristinia sonorae]